MNVNNINISTLIPYTNNARTHDENQVKQIASSIKEFGFNNPVLIDSDGGIIAGHGRVQAAQLLNLTEVPTITLHHLSETQKKAYILADNRMALNAGWDIELLKLEMESLDELDFDLSLTGFDDEEISEFLKEDIDPQADENAIPEIPKDPISKLGDIWILGNHRVMCGDSTSIDAVEKLMNGNKADMVFTDPPYGMSYGGGRAQGNHSLNKRGGVVVKAHGMIIGDDLRGDDLIQMIAESLSSSKANAKDGASFYIFFRGEHTQNLSQL